MALKFKRRQKLFPGVYLNYSSKGISTTIGVKGLSINLKKSGSYLNTGSPRTDVYNRKKVNLSSLTEQKNIENAEQNNFTLSQEIEGEIRSKDVNEITSLGLINLKETILEAYKEKKEIEAEIMQLGKATKIAKNVKVISKYLIIGFIFKWFENNYIEKSEYLDNLKTQFKECHVNIDINHTDNKDNEYNKLKKVFEQLSGSQKIWDLTSSVKNHDNRSSAYENVTRNETTIGFKTLPFINTKYKAMYFHNKNGSDIYIYPGFVILFDDNKNFGMVELNEFDIKFSHSRFIEREEIPKDSQVIGSTWAKVNKNGTPDKRFKFNYEIPIVKYGELLLKSNTGIYEVFLFSNSENSKAFCEEYKRYKSI